MEFLTLENIWLQQIRNWVTVVYGNGVPSYAMVIHWVAEFRWARKVLNNVVSADSANLFKSRLDKFWKSYDFLYDYKA